MRLKYYALALLVILVLGIGSVFFLAPVPKNQLDIAQVNDITATLANDFDSLGTEDYLLPNYKNLDYTVIDSEGNLRAATRRGLSESINDAMKHGDLIVDITKDGQIIGKAIFYNDEEAQWQNYRNSLQALVIIVLVLAIATCGAFYLVVHRVILRPFNRMQGFAQRVAAGDLDIPLEMDKSNAFGAFTESFDLMRDELRQARENERAAEQSKRELVASLSHDIQTPVASIKAVAELMELSADEAQLQKLKTIQQKSEQINTLVVNLFHATLEELNSLNVNPLPFSSDQLADIIKKADYQDKVRIIDKIPDCLVQADPVRLAQVIDNVITNSYKYANTTIDVSAKIVDNGLAITLRDYGPGANVEELPLLFTKYFRGASSEGKNGYGLGLFISRFLIDRMGGVLECENGQSEFEGGQPGFVTKIWLKLDN